MNTMLDDNAAKAAEIGDLLKAGFPHTAYRTFNAIWAVSLKTIPEHLCDGLIHHVLRGQPTGGFLFALLSNDLYAAAAIGDPVSRANLLPLIMFVKTCTPRACCGSAKAVKAWREEGGALSIGRRADLGPPA